MTDFIATVALEHVKVIGREYFKCADAAEEGAPVFQPIQKSLSLLPEKVWLPRNPLLPHNTYFLQPFAL